jgi:hypothetical protein
MSLPTARDLIERLREIHALPGEKLSDEALAAKLPITGSTLARWKRRDPEKFSELVQMMTEAGWLNMGGDAHADVWRTRDPLVELQATVEAQGLATTQALKALTVGIRKLERRIGAEAPRAKKASG